MAIPSYATPVEETRIPSYAVPVDEDMGQPSAPQGGFGSMLQSGLNILAPQLGNLAAAVAQNPSILLSGAKGLLGAVPQAVTQTAAGLSGVAAPFSPLAQLLPQESQAVPTTSPQASNALAMAASVIPTAKSLEELPSLANLVSSGGKKLLNAAQDTSFVKNLTGKNVDDAVQNFGNEARNTLTDLFGTSKVSPTDELQQNATNVLQQMYGTPDFKNMIGKENQNLSQAVFNAHQQNYQIGSDRFNQTLADTNPIVAPEDSFINSTESNKLNTIMQMDPLLADKIITANDTPNLRNLHEVQSQMGAMIADKKSVPYSQRDNDSINLLSNFRNQIINNISNYAPQYKADQAFWRQNVIPYYQNSAINNLVRQGIQPANISNILSKPELPSQPEGTVNTILRHLTPLQQQQIPLAKLAGSQSNPLLDLSGNINAANFAKNAQGLTTKNMAQFIPPNIQQNLIGLGQDLKDSNLYNSISNNVQDISGNIDPEQLVNNLKNINLSTISPSQKLTLQGALSRLSGLSDNIEKQQAKTEGLKSLLRRSAAGAAILGGIETGRRIF